MTLERAPGTYQDALDRVKSHPRLGAKRLAELTGIPEKTLYDWSHPDNDRGPPIGVAEQLDLIYREHGGEGSPFLDIMAHRLGDAHAGKYGGQIAVTKATASFLKEAGEAGAAFLRAALPGAGRRERDDATREGLEMLNAGKAVLGAVSQLDTPGASAPQPP